MLKRVLMLLAVVALACGALLPLGASAQTPPPPTSSLLVKLVAGLTPEDQAAVIARNGGVETGSIPALRLHVVEVLTADLPTVLASYQADPLVQHVEENKVRRSEALPSDPLYVNQWALPKIAWDQVFGTVTPTGSAVVALLDTGVDAPHSDLAGKLVPGTSILPGGNELTDPNGPRHVAGRHHRRQHRHGPGRGHRWRRLRGREDHADHRAQREWRGPRQRRHRGSHLGG